MYLFSEYDFLSVTDAQRKSMERAIDEVESVAIADGSVEEAVNRFVGKFALEVPRLLEGAIAVSAEEAQVDATYDPNRVFFGPGPHFVPGIRVEYFVPFTGDRNIFRCSPTTFGGSHPSADLLDSELKFVFERADQDVAATRSRLTEEIRLVNEKLRWLSERASQLNEALPGIARERIVARRTRISQLSSGTASLGIPIRRAEPPKAPSGGDKVEPPSKELGSYDVALSFAGEDRDYVEQVAQALVAAGIHVFYDDFEKIQLWGKNLADHFAHVYQSSRYVIMFISAHYVQKTWTRYERQQAQARALLLNDEYILPARFDDTDVPGVTSTVAHVDLRKTTPAELAGMIRTKLGKG